MCAVAHSYNAAAIWRPICRQFGTEPEPTGSGPNQIQYCDRFDHYNIRHKQQWSDPATLNNTSDKFEFGCQAAAHMSGMSTLTWKILIEANKHPSTPYDWKRRIIFHVALCVNHFGGINVSYVNFYTSPVFSAPAGGYPIGIS